MAAEAGQKGSRTTARTTARTDAMKPGFHCVRTHWNRGFIAFQLTWRTRNVRLMVPVGPESGFGNVPPGRGAGLEARAAGPDWG
jgi:hypothetical protein